MGLQTLRTIQKPHEPMPRLKDLMEWLATPEVEKIWVVLDIKATFLQTARELLPSYPLAHISASLLYLRHFLSIPDLGFNVNQKSILGLPGWLFLREIQRDDKLLLTWTVNEPRWMEWCIRQNLRPSDDDSGHDSDGGHDVKPASTQALIDGVITDDPALYLRVCKRIEDELDGRAVKPQRGFFRWVTDGVTTLWTTFTFQCLPSHRLLFIEEIPGSH